MTSVGTENEQQQSSSENSHQNHMEAVFGDSYTFGSGDQARDQATTQAELVAAAVAAAANNSNGAGNYHALVASTAPGNDNVIATATTQSSDPTQAAELVKRELANQKVRAENRERKKRWREQNEDRNKDNDLRCRVNKRANRLFGKMDSDAKREWIQEEFAKRQRKRQDKERRKNAVNGSMGPGASGQDMTSSSGYQSPSSMASFTSSQLEALQQQSSEFYPMSASGIPPLSPTTATKLLNSNLAAVLKAGKNDPSATAAAAAAVLQSPQFLQLNQLLSQQSAEAAQYTSEMAPSESGTKSENIDYKLPLEQIEAVVSAVAAASGEAEKGDASTNGQSASEEGKESEKQAEGSKPANGQGGGDYPMDAVMTLMQLNAGWRQ